MVSEKESWIGARGMDVCNVFILFFSIFILLHQDVWAKGADSDSETAAVDTEVR